MVNVEGTAARGVIWLLEDWMGSQCVWKGMDRARRDSFEDALGYRRKMWCFGLCFRDDVFLAEQIFPVEGEGWKML